MNVEIALTVSRFLNHYPKDVISGKINLNYKPFVQRFVESTIEYTMAFVMKGKNILMKLKPSSG